MTGNGHDPLVVVRLQRGELPVFCDADTPSTTGWTVVGFARVYKDRGPAGVFVGLTVGRDGTSVLTYEAIRRIER